MKLALLNTSIITAYGNYTLKPITQEHAKFLVANNEIDSAIGHEATAIIMSALLETEIPFNRQLFTQEIGQVALVFKMNGRIPEGTILSVEDIKQIGFSWKVLIRHS